MSGWTSQGDREPAYDLPSPQKQPKLSPQSSVLSTVSVSSSSLQSQIEQNSSYSSLSLGYNSSQESLPTSHTHQRPRPLDIIAENDNSIFGSFQNSIYSSVEEDRRRVEKQLEAFEGPCLIDCIEVSLRDVDVFSAKNVRVNSALSYRIVRQPGNVLKEKGAAKLYIERNLYEDFCRNGKSLTLFSGRHCIYPKVQFVFSGASYASLIPRTHYHSSDLVVIVFSLFSS